MKTRIEERDLNHQAPHSPRDRFGGYAILGRTVDKCRANIAGKIGEYHYDCPLDNQLFGFKGVNGAQFKEVASSARSYEDVAAWLDTNGIKRTAQEVKEWSNHMDALKLKDIPIMQDPEHRKEVSESCRKLGLNFETARLFEWLDADDKGSFHNLEAMAHA